MPRSIITAARRLALTALAATLALAPPLAGCQETPRAAGPAGGHAMPEPELPSLDNRRWLVHVRAPGADFQLLDEAAAKALHPKAVLGLEEPPRCHGFVIVTPLAGRALEDIARAALSEVDLRGEDRRLVQDEATLYCSLGGWRVEAWGTNAAGAAVGHRITVVAEQGHAFTFHAVAGETIHTRMRRCLDSVTAAFDLLDGTLTPE